MLVLQRNLGQSVILTLTDGRRVTIKLCKNRLGQTALGVDAPKDIRVHREEVQERVDKRGTAGPEKLSDVHESN